MVVIHQVSLDCTNYMLGVFAIEVSHLIGTCRYIYIYEIYATQQGMLSSAKWHAAVDDRLSERGMVVSG